MDELAGARLSVAYLRPTGELIRISFIEPALAFQCRDLIINWQVVWRLKQACFCRSQQGIHSASTRGSSQLTELLEDADEDNIFEIVRHLTLYAAKRRGLQVEGEDEVMEMVEDLWAAIYSDTYKLAVWAACYILLGAFFFCTWASAQAWVYLPSQALLPAQGRQIIVLTSKVLATAAASGFCISAALHLKPEAADPLPQSVQESYSHLDELLPILQDLRIINFFAMLLVCGKLMIRLWA